MRVALVWGGVCLCSCGISRSMGDADYNPHVFRDYAEDMEDMAFLWQKVSEDDFCQLMRCVELTTEVDKEVVRDLKSSLEQVVQHLNIKDIPAPELVFVRSKGPLHHHLVAHSGGGFDLISPEIRSRHFTQFIKGEFHPVPFRQASKIINVLDETQQKYLLAKLDGMHSVDQLSEDDINYLMEPMQLSDFGVYPEGIVRMMNKIFSDKMNFYYDQPNKQIHYKTLKSGEGSEFNWQAEGIYFYRKINKIIYVLNQPPSEIVYDQLLIHLLWEVAAYYNVHFGKMARLKVYPNEPTVQIVSDKNLQRRQGRVNPITTLTIEETQRIFRDQPYVMKKYDANYAPEIFILLHFLEVSQEVMHHEAGIQEGARLGLMSESPAVRRFAEKFRRTKMWNEYKNRINLISDSPPDDQHKKQQLIEAFSQHNLSFLKVIGDLYDDVPLPLIQEAEALIAEVYKSRGMDAFFLFEIHSIGEAVGSLARSLSRVSFQNGELLDSIAREVSYWLISKRGANLDSYFKLFSQMIESYKSSYNRRRSDMIQSQAYPYYRVFEIDELITYFLSILKKPFTSYENYLFWGVSNTDKTRCLLDVQYQDNLLDYYSFHYVTARSGTPQIICLRVLNMRKEWLRHGR